MGMVFRTLISPSSCIVGLGMGRATSALHSLTILRLATSDKVLGLPNGRFCNPERLDSEGAAMSRQPRCKIALRNHVAQRQ